LKEVRATDILTIIDAHLRSMTLANVFEEGSRSAGKGSPFDGDAEPFVQIIDPDAPHWS